MNATTRKASVPMLVWQLLLGATLLWVWQLGVTHGWMDKFFFSRPSDVAERVWKMFASGSIWAHLATTMTEAALSFGIGVLSGVMHTCSAPLIWEAAAWVKADVSTLIRVGASSGLASAVGVSNSSSRPCSTIATLSHSSSAYYM